MSATDDAKNLLAQQVMELDGRIAEAQVVAEETRQVYVIAQASVDGLQRDREALQTAIDALG